MRRRRVLGIVAGLSLVAGCPSRPEPTVTPTPTGTPDSGGLVGDGPGDYPHPIRVDNSLDRAVTVTITVERDGEVLYDRTHTVEPGTERVVAGFTRLTAPAGSRNVRVTAALADGNAESIDFTVDDCHGEIIAYFGEDGDLELTYSVC
ncbi:hypothetical protein [Salinigranum sp. GCM10025319]|uniref:hypothetical protein n=1 Tax=Salinigranum sp. GCM10025319 TaxID=3252687 RepID=UPI003610B7E1